MPGSIDVYIEAVCLNSPGIDGWGAFISDGTAHRKLHGGNPEEPHPVDIYVGERVRYFRELKGMTQQQLSKQIGVRFQQVQKYESGANRTSASRLFLICEAFDITLLEFFADL